MVFNGHNTDPSLANTVSGCHMDGRGSFSGTDYPIRQRVQTASEDKPISYPSGNVSYLSTVKVLKRKIN
jgi:hypothetical protein